MAQNTLKPSEQMALVGVIDPDLNAAGTYTTGWIAAKDFTAFMAIVMAGTLGTDATIDAKLEQATDASGAGAKDVPDAAITQLVKATDDDKQAVIECFSDSLDLLNGFTHLRLSMTVATASSDSGALVWGVGGRYEPASDYNLASVAEIVAA